MKELIVYCREVLKTGPSITDGQAEALGVYPRSVHIHDGSVYFLFKDGSEKLLGIYGGGKALSAFEGAEYSSENGALKICACTSANCRALRTLFPELNPSSRKGHAVTIGLGDRLGLAGPGHIRTARGTGVFPVLAQQSIRELMLTGRTYDDVLSSAAWAVFEEGYTGGYGADGDHLKNAFEIEYAVGCGFTMITLDCSEHIDNTAATADEESLRIRYETLDRQQRDELERRYLNQSFTLNSGEKIAFDMAELMRSALIYEKAIDFAAGIYKRFIEPDGLDFEISVDETSVPTTPENHFFVANEIYLRGMQVETLAPRFCGEFQKGIDYIGDTKQFEAEYAVHQAIADHFGYRLSIHSGSDKFTIFPIVGALSKSGLHVKTAGTNWLEALRVVAVKDPALMRRIYAYAVEHLNTAKAYYHINPTVQTAPDISSWKDEELEKLLNIDATRQILHITYGLLLNEKHGGKYVFKTALYKLLSDYENEYAETLVRHIGRHLRTLGIQS